DLCIITPYEGQRGLITRLLKAANLPADSVYNVDSFQGHEAPYVIVSTVRTDDPGFLVSPNRMNVMLSRCQRGMVLVTQRAFVHGRGADTLFAKLIREWEAGA
ncbi:AAA domain-containing protein, partial [Trametes polyzona]